MTNPYLASLKKIGHDLLNEYVSLDMDRGRGHKGSVSQAYTKLASKIDYNPHFSSMTNEEQIKTAISKLRYMIKKRKSKLEFMGYGKVAFAPNVEELQRNFKTKIISS